MITIIGILIALLLPAVQAAREAARRLQCRNNLKQIALGFLNHEDAHKQFPTGGWGHMMIGDPDRGIDRRQPGGWEFASLPYIEQAALHQLGAGAATDSAEHRAANARRITTPLAIMNCPSRRRPLLFATVGYPHFVSVGYIGNGVSDRPYYCDFVNQAARGDYAACSGDANQDVLWRTRTGVRYEIGDSPAYSMWHNPMLFTGICFQRSEIKISDISDGTSHTYMVGEKYLCADYYFTGQDDADDQMLLCGWNNDNFRCTYYNPSVPGSGVPRQDTPGLMLKDIFGSAHAGGLHMALCDGSVQWINYTIDPEVHRRLGSRKDGFVVDGREY
ncbi:MAG: DUF1559 domain-containing protein [Pirellulaceae bacterium]|nr:DUF1559 domain-containing protein [Pirellulaceae bacterium]